MTTWFTIAAPTRMICIRSWYWRRNACEARLRLLGREHVRAVLLPPPRHLHVGQPPGRVDVEAGRHLLRRELVPARVPGLIHSRGRCVWVHRVISCRRWILTRSAGASRLVGCWSGAERRRCQPGRPRWSGRSGRDRASGRGRSGRRGRCSRLRSSTKARCTPCALSSRSSVSSMSAAVTSMSVIGLALQDDPTGLALADQAADLFAEEPRVGEEQRGLPPVDDDAGGFGGVGVPFDAVPPVERVDTTEDVAVRAASSGGRTARSTGRPR